MPTPGGGLDVVQAFIWRGDSMMPLGVLPGMLRSFAMDISDDDTITGYCRTLSTGEDVTRAFVWRNGTMAALDTLVPGTSIQSIRIAWGMNDHGQILASARQLDGENVVVILTPVGLNQGDINCTCSTDTDDLLLLLGEWGQTDSSADANRDGTVDAIDLAIVLTNWSP